MNANTETAAVEAIEARCYSLEQQVSRLKSANSRLRRAGIEALCFCQSEPAWLREWNSPTSPHGTDEAKARRLKELTQLAGWLRFYLKEEA